MKFKLNVYNRNTSDEDLINDLKEVANKIGKTTLTMEEYNNEGKYSSSHVRRRFGSWSECMKKAGLEVGKQMHIEKDEILLNVKEVASLLNKESISYTEYSKYGKYDTLNIIKRLSLKTWDEVLIASGLQVTGYIKKYADEELLNEIGNMWIKLGRQPTSDDVKNGVTKMSYNAFARRFDGWRGALNQFIEYINTDKPSDILETYAESTREVKVEEDNFRNKTRRNIGAQLRFRILTKDGFKCCACGNSPAVDSTCILHVDHIFPYSKGGETVEDNLQTLCQKSNWGKSDKIF